MQRVLFPIGLLAILIAFSGVVCAQDLGSFGLPAPFNRTSCDAVSTFEVYSGWFESGSGLRFGIETDTPGPLPIDVVRVDYTLPTRGLWLGAGTNIAIADPVMFFGRGWILAPNQASVDGTIILGIPVRESQESNAISWWYLDALAGLDVLPGTALLAGVRFEQHQNTLQNRSWFSGGTPIAGVEGQTKLDFVNWIPLFGLSATIGDRSSGLTASALYTPVFSAQVEAKMGFTAAAGPTWGPGVVKVKDTVTGGYFFEAMVEYSTSVMGANIGAFARFSSMHGKSNKMRMSWNGAGWPAGLEVPYSGAFDRTGWTIGGSLALDFATGTGLADFL